MNDKLDLSNPYIRKLKKYIKGVFNQPPVNFLKDIIDSYEIILKSNAIELSKVIKPFVFRDKKYSSEDRIKLFLNKNGSKTYEKDGLCFLHLEISNYIIKCLKGYKTTLSIPQHKVSDASRSFTYRDAKEADYDDEIIPLENTDIISVKLNLFYNKDVRYVFNEKITQNPLDISISTLQSLKIKINGILEENIMPIKMKVVCTQKTKGVECGNIVYFSDVHLNSEIRCTDSKKYSDSNGHRIKKLEKAVIDESKKLYVYEGVDLLSSNSEELIICSLEPLTNNILSVNAIFVNERNSKYILVLSAKQEQIKLLKKPILMHSPNSMTFLSDIYKSIQKYLKEYHNIILTNQNRIIGQVIIFILLNNIIFKKRMNSLIVGKSGSGKSVWAEFLIPLFTLNHKTILGTDVTRNKFVGGKSNLISSSMNSLFSAGYVATQDIVFAEECTNSLKDFKDPRTNQQNNIFHLVKSCSGREIDVAIQGGQKVYPKASTILVGNLEQLDFTQEYKVLVASKYRKLSSGFGDSDSRNYKEKFPLFKPIGYYIHILKNRNLAEAHSIVRQNYRGISGYNYITRLPPAEQARYAFFITLEDDLDNTKIKRELKNKEILTNPKRECFMKELTKTFCVDGEIKECPIELKKQINDFYNDEFYESRHNFKNIFGVNKGLNTHIENNIVMIMEQLVWMNRLYNKTFPDTLTNDEKEMIYYFLSFNYNVLGKDEASMYKKPFINDFYELKQDSINIDLKSKEDYFELKEEEKKKEDEELKKMLDDDTAVNLL